MHAKIYKQLQQSRVCKRLLKDGLDGLVLPLTPMAAPLGTDPLAQKYDLTLTGSSDEAGTETDGIPMSIELGSVDAEVTVRRVKSNIQTSI